MNWRQVLFIAATVCFGVVFVDGLGHFGTNDLVPLGLTFFSAAHI